MPIVLAAGLALLVLAICVILLQSPTSVIATNGVSPNAELVATQRRAGACQIHEVLPGRTSAIRLTLVAEVGPKISVDVKSGGRIITHGVRRAGWTGGAVTVPVKRVSQAIPNVDVCFTLAQPLEPVAIFGEYTPEAVALTASGGQKLGGRIRIEYLRPGSTSWFSLSPSIARHMGLGHALAGTWIVLALLAAMVSSAILCSWLILRELR